MSEQEIKAILDRNSLRLEGMKFEMQAPGVMTDDARERAESILSEGLPTIVHVTAYLKKTEVQTHYGIGVSVHVRKVLN